MYINIKNVLSKSKSLSIIKKKTKERGKKQMKLNFKGRREKGITLIALVITIIVLLILVGVTIATLTGENGILTKAKTAQTTTNEENAKEQIKTAVMGSYGKDGKLNYGDLKTNLEQIGIKELPNEALYPLKVTLDGVKATIKENGEVEFQNGKTIEVGDYVAYDPTLEANASDLSYTSTTDKTGADSNQEFNVSTYKKAGYGWRVLGVSNGKIRLISEEFIGAGDYTDSNRTYYRLEGQKGYINGIEELNNISAIFGHGKGAESATSITVDDINAITGYNPETAKYGKGDFGEYGNKVTYTRGSGTALSSSATNGKTWSGTRDTFNYYDKTNKTFKALTTGSTEITSTSYYYNPTTLNSNSEKPTQGVDESGVYNTVYQMLFGKYTVDQNNYSRNFIGTGAKTLYWLASDYAHADSYSVYWGLRNVEDGAVEYIHYCLYNSGGYDAWYSYGVRPVVSLKSDVSLEWNEAANEWEINNG